MRVAAVVVTHNRPELLQQALAALRLQTRPLDAIVVVDNASNPASAARLGRPDDVTVLRSDTNLGGAGGFALGMAHAFAAGHDWIWLLDDDAIARPDALARLCDAIDALRGRAEDIGAVCGTVREFGDIALQHRRRYHRVSGLERALPRAAYAGAPCRTDTASFVGLLIPATAIARAGLPEPAFFLAYDDTEYALRLGRAGLPIWLAPTSVVEHLRERRGRLRAGPFGSKHYFTIRNRIAVARAYASLPPAATGVGVTFALALWLASGGVFQRGALRILLRAIADGVHGRLGGYPETLARLQRRRPWRRLGIQR
ncbi:glycosyltransferase [Massilia sp. 9096]|uniref:glycosyltransferase n=1 Tax=Massilia sp. 9096 TaxID=1500894 RepID=UPI00068CD3BC|nr:glycosyltransferase [Massilia sp. 9096]